MDALFTMTRTYVCNMLTRFETVRLQCITCIDNIDDAVSKTYDGCKFKGAIELDDVNLPALLGKIVLSDIHKLACHAKTFGSYGLAQQARLP